MTTHTPGAIAVEANPLVVPQGANWAEGWSYCEGDPLDVPAGWPGSWSARMEVRTRRGGDLVLSFHSAAAADGLLTLGSLADVTVTKADGTTVTADVATVTASLTPAATVNKTQVDKTLVFDLELVGPGGRVIRLVEGELVISREVTVDA